jgi:hypothetical protein
MGIFVALDIALVFKHSGYRISSSSGKSMCPNGQKLSLDLNKIITHQDEIKVGEIYNYVVTYPDGKRGNIHHRCVGIAGDVVMFKGDNNHFYEEVPIDAIYEKVIYELPLIKCSEEDIK